MKYFLIHNQNNIFHYGEILEEQKIQTNLPFIHFYDNLDDLKSKLNELGQTYNEVIKINYPIDF
jgi:hypothetical protein